MHNSLVGHKITHSMFLFLLFVNSIIGKPKAAVLPVPVWAVAIISVSELRIIGITLS